MIRRLLLYQLSIMAIPIAFASSQESIIYPGEAYIQSANYSGTGCPLGSANFIFHQGANQFSVNFKHFKASNHTNYNASYCELKFKIVAPPGVAYQLHALKYQGHAELDQSSMATISNDSRLQGSSTINKSTQYLYGSLDNTDAQYFQQSALRNHYQTWSACSRHSHLEIATKVNLNSKNNQSFITINKISGKILFSRKHCNNKPTIKSN